MPYILALDQGTTSSRAIVFDHDGGIRAVAQKEFTQIFPQAGWVEHDPGEIWASQISVAVEALGRGQIKPGDLAAVGITNQRETTIVWDRETGEPIHNAIVWQDRRTADYCETLKAEGHGDTIQQKTGLLIDAYFSASKIRWLLDNVPGAKARADAGKLAFGTVDSWLVWKLTGGAVHATDVSNASRTLLFDLGTLAWDDELLGLFGVPRSVLPEIVPSSGAIGEATLLGARIPIAGLAGDQQAALFGQACFEPGLAKATLGTGTFLLANAGPTRPGSTEGLVETVAWSLGEGAAVYAVEGSVFVTGGAVRWLRDALGLFADAGETEALARSVPDNGGVYFVPALAGLGSPHWVPEARGLVTGISGGTRREHLVRAALEATAYQTRDVVEALPFALAELRVDGGGAANGFVLQALADLTRLPVEVPTERETTALGAAALAGLALGTWGGLDEITGLRRRAARFEPELAEEEAERLLGEWRLAVRRALLR
jgi:glycerol kinase